jgi:hypothetical protein
MYIILHKNKLISLNNHAYDQYGFILVNILNILLLSNHDISYSFPINGIRIHFHLFIICYT